jgi:hypothetical protein
MFEPDEYVKSTRPSTRFIIEGLDTIAQTSSVTDSTKSFSQSNAKHIECSLANKILCDDLNNQYNNKVAIVAELEPAYMTARNAYDSCNNHKNRCIGITTTINNTETYIKEYNTDINTKTETLKTCDADKAECEKLQKRITDKEKQIADLKGYIATNEDLQKQNMCFA